MKKLIGITVLLFNLVILTACSKNQRLDDNENDDLTAIPTQSESDRPISIDNPEVSNNAFDRNNIAKETREYILIGQDDEAEYEKIKWSKTFLDLVDIESLYEQYIKNFGELKDIYDFAIYITENAPIQSNWEELFISDVKQIYGADISKIELLDDVMYQAYIINEGKEVPYVAVNARTGYFHG